MAVTNLLKSQVDQPVFEWMRFAPTSTTSASSFTFNQYTYGRYMYYQVSQAMWRYDTYSDSWQETSPPPATPSTISQIKHTDVFGYRGHTISATSTTITIAGFGNLSNAANGLKIRIIAGMGAGQERTITSSASAVIADFGVVSSASASAITDNTKKWRFNQWDGYQCRLTFNTGQTQIRKVQYNDTTTLTFSDTNFQPIDPFNNTGFSTVSPYAAPTNVGTVTGYVIESTTLTIDSAWTVTPDQSSIYMIMSGGVWYIANSSSTPFTSLHWYDILTDCWQSKTNVATFSATAGLNGNAGEFSIERLGETGGTYLFGSFTGGTAASGITMALSAGLTYETDRWANHKIEIINGKGIAQKRRIVGNNGFTFWINKKWDITPDSTSHFTVSPNSNYLWLLSGESVGAMYAYAIEEDLWTVGPLADSGIARNFSATPYAGTTYGPPHEGFALSSIVRTTSGILSGTVNAGGTNYVIGDLVTCSTTGTNGTFFVTGINTSTGAVTSLELAASGSGYSAGSSSTTGGSGTGLTITLTVGTTALVTTATNHDFKGPSGGVVQETVTIAGCATDTTFNANFGVIGVGSLTTFSIAAPASSASPTAANSQSTTLLVDSTKNWATNELVGKLLFVQTAGTSPTVQGRKISANTANTISFSSSALSPAATNGTSRYSIQEPRLYGALVTNKIPNRVPYGWATSGTATTLVDTTKDWTRNQWINCRVRVVSGTGTGNESVITANSSNTLTVASWGVATPDTTSKYEILDSYGVYTAAAFSTVQTDSNKNYVTNSLTGKGIKLVTGLAIQNVGVITSNTATTITTSSTTFNTDTATHYCVIDIAARGQGFKFVWLHGLSDLNRRGRYLFANRGGAANGYDMYDIPSNTWDVTIFPQNGSITWTQGTMIAYDGLNSVFFIKDATGRVYEFDMSTFNINPGSIAPYPPSGSAYGNRMEVLTTADGLKYLYVMRHLGQEMWRTLKFW